MHSSNNESYISINDTTRHDEGERTPWYWRLIAMAASWMILAGYLILPGLYAKDSQLRFSQAVLSVFVVALLTAGYSFTALLCFACRNETFQAEGVFLPALTSSALGLTSIAYNFLSSRAYIFSTAAISGTVLSAFATFLYGTLLLWSSRRATRKAQGAFSRPALWSEQSYYSNFVANMYPTATRSPAATAAVSEDDRVNAQMALLLMKSDARPSPDANSTFRIDLPEDREQREREAHSQELVGTPAQTHVDWNRGRADSRPDSLGEDHAWQQWQGRGREANRASSVGTRSNHERNFSREERRREIELGNMHG